MSGAMTETSTVASGELVTGTSTLMAADGADEVNLSHTLPQLSQMAPKCEIDWVYPNSNSKTWKTRADIMASVNGFPVDRAKYPPNPFPEGFGSPRQQPRERKRSRSRSPPTAAEHVATEEFLEGLIE
jgi:hypothetical protein